MASTRSISTAAEMMATPHLGRCELVRGKLRQMSPAGFEHGCRIVRIAAPLDVYVSRHRLGVITGAETGFFLERNPDTVRAPDVAFIRKDRIPNPPPAGYFPGAPDLAVEVLSPGDSASEVLEKVADWMAGGTQVVWLVDPRRRSITIHQTGQAVSTLHLSDTLTCPELLAGFSLPVSEVFRDV